MRTWLFLLALLPACGCRTGAGPAAAAPPAARSEKQAPIPVAKPPVRLADARIPASAAKYRTTVVREARAKGGLSAPSAMFAAQLHQESGYNPEARSGVGAEGLAQFMPATAQWISRVYPKDLPGAASLDPQWSIRALVFYDFWLHDRLPMYTEADENRWAAALSGYNGGLGYAIKDARLSGCSLWWGCAELVDDGRTTANLRENRGYPRKIIRLLEPAYRKAGW